MKLRCLIVLICLSGYVFGQEKVNYYEKYRTINETCEQIMSTVLTSTALNTIRTALDWNLYVLKELELTAPDRVALLDFDRLLNYIHSQYWLLSQSSSDHFFNYIKYKETVNNANKYMNDDFLDANIERIKLQFEQYQVLVNLYNNFVNSWNFIIVYYKYDKLNPRPEIKYISLPTIMW